MYFSSAPSSSTIQTSNDKRNETCRLDMQHMAYERH